MNNPTDVQALISVLIADVQMAIAAEQADYDYDRYLSHGELDEDIEDKHELRIDALGVLITDLEWYRGVEPSYSQRKVKQTGKRSGDVPSDNAAEARGE